VLGRQPQKLVFAGCSAGGRGAMANLDYVSAIVTKAAAVRAQHRLGSNRLGSKNSVVGMLDSPAWIDLDASTGSPRVGSDLATTTTVAVKLFNAYGRLGTLCAKKYPGAESWKCIFRQYRLPLLQTPFLISASQYDSFQANYKPNHVS